jgi:YfiH family protein
VGVHTADCVPILLAHREIPVAAAVHAGWRGLAAGIVEETVRVLSARFGDAAVGGIVAAAGPCARGCCYEVGEETAEALHGLPGDASLLRKGKAPGKWTADLQGIALAALKGAGIPAGQTEAAGPCTICSPFFHSFRRDRSAAARQLSFLYIRD